MMEKETSTRRSLLRALYLLPLVCISLALNAETKVNYVYDNGKSNSAQLKNDKNVSYDMVVNEIKMDGEALEGLPLERILDLMPDLKIDANGSITTSKGDQVKKIIVNGKELYKKVEPSANAAPTVPKVSVLDSGDAMNMEFTGFSEESVEDLIKTLPGAEVDENGNITVNGKRVSKVLVNGKRVLPNTGIPVEENAEEIVRLAEEGNFEEAFDLLPGATRDQDGNLYINGKLVSKVLVNGKEYINNDPDHIYASEIVDEVEGKTPEGKNRIIYVNVDENSDQVTIKSEDKAK